MRYLQIRDAPRLWVTLDSQQLTDLQSLFNVVETATLSRRSGSRSVVARLKRSCEIDMKALKDGINVLISIVLLAFIATSLFRIVMFLLHENQIL